RSPFRCCPYPNGQLRGNDVPPRRSRRSQPRRDSGRPRPPTGNLEPIEDLPVTRPEPVSPDPLTGAARTPPPEVINLYARFEIVSAALSFAEQLPADQPLRSVSFLRGGPGDAWWVRARLTLDAAREMVSVVSGRAYLPSGDRLIRDR